MFCKRSARVLGAMALALWLGACGFSLRGTDSMPAALAHTFVQASNQSLPLVREFDRQLTIAGGATTKAVADATATLRILNDDSGERVLSLATTGGPEELEAYHIVAFELVRDGQRIYGPDTLTLRRDYTFDKNDILGKRREYATLRDQLRRDIVALMLRRLTLAPQIT